MARQKPTPNNRFKETIKQPVLGLAAQEGIEVSDAKAMIRDELEERELLPSRSRPRSDSADREPPNPMDHWMRGYVPSDWRVVEYLVDLGLNRAKLDTGWAKEFLRAAGYRSEDIESILSRLAPQNVPDNLPQYDPTRFVGRAAELDRLRRLLSSRSKVWSIQIDGIGGVGKSTLAKQIAHWYKENYPRLPSEERFEAIIWISAKQEELDDGGGIRQRFYPFLNLNDVYAAIADTLDRPDIREADERRRARLIYQALGRRRTLLIADNLEADWGSALVSFISDVPPPTKVVLTTRLLLNVMGEPQRIRLEGMASEDALQLIKREAGLKNVRLSEEDAVRLQECTNGIPLVAKWCIGHMAFGFTIDDVLSYLNERDTDVNRFIFEKSIQLIETRPAYRLLLALAFAPDDLPGEALGMMAGLELNGLRRAQELAELEKLSLVEHDPEGKRFSLLPLTRAYLKPRLDDSLDLQQSFLLGLARYYQLLFPAGEEGPNRFWYGINSFQLTEQLAREWTNVRDVLERLYKAGDHGNLLTLGLPLVHTMNLLGLRPERLELCRRMIESARELRDPAEAWLLMDGLGWMLHLAGRHNEWLEAIEEGRQAVARYGGPDAALILADVHEAYVHIVRGDMARAEALLRDASRSLPLDEALFSTDFITRLVASRLCDRLVNYSEDERDYARAREICYQSLELRRSLNEDLGSTYYKIGYLSLQLDEFDVAREAYNECLETVSHRKYYALSHLGLAQIAEREMAAADEAAREGLTYFDLSVIEERLQEWAEAEQHARQALSLLERLGMDKFALEARDLIARIDMNIPR